LLHGAGKRCPVQRKGGRGGGLGGRGGGEIKNHYCLDEIIILMEPESIKKGGLSYKNNEYILSLH